MSPTNKYKLFASTLGGIFKTEDGGESGWQNISGNLPDIPFTAIAIDSSNEHIVYVGSFNGVYKTENGGEDWRLISTDDFKSKFVNLKAIAFKDSLLFVGTQMGLNKSKDGGISWQEANSGLENACIFSIFIQDKNKMFVGTAEGIYKSADEGDSWQRISDQLYANNIQALDFGKNTEESILYIGTDGAGIDKSGDNGYSWSNLNVSSGFLYISDIEVCKNNTATIYAGFFGNYSPKMHQSHTGILRTKDNGESWQYMEHEIGGKFVLCVAANPENEDIVYAGTLNGIYKSVDSGDNWFRCDSGRVGPDGIGVIRINPLSPSIIYAGNDGGSIYQPHGIFKSEDSGQSWVLKSDGLPTTSFITIQDIAINPNNTSSIYAVLDRAGIFKSENSGDSWKEAFFATSDTAIYSIAIDPSDTNIIYAAGRKIYMSTDAGSSWQEILDGVPENFGFVNEIRVDPNDPRYVYAATFGSGVLRLYRSSSGIDEKVEVIPQSFVLKQNYPNPFNPETRIEYSVAANRRILLQIFNQRGQLIRTLVNEPQAPGSYMKIWDGKDDLGRNVSSGIYLYRLRAGKFSVTKKMIKLQ